MNSVIFKHTYLKQQQIMILTTKANRPIYQTKNILLRIELNIRMYLHESIYMNVCTVKYDFMF